MVSHLSKQQQLINPRLVGAIFFAILASLFSLLAKYTLLLFGSNLLPLLNALLIAIAVGGLLGALFGYTLAKKLSWVKLLLIGILIGCIALVLISLMGFVDFMEKETVFKLTNLIDYLIIYSSILFSYFILIGIWMIPLVLLATIYFNKRLWPGFVVWAQKQPPAQTN